MFSATHFCGLMLSYLYIWSMVEMTVESNLHELKALFYHCILVID